MCSRTADSRSRTSPLSGHTPRTSSIRDKPGTGCTGYTGRSQVCTLSWTATTASDPTAAVCSLN